jgi:hypothetical protein
MSRSRAIARHHLQLLPVLLAEGGDIGAGLQEQLGADGRDAAEMAGSRIAFPAGGGAGHLDHRGGARRVHGLDRRHPDQVAAGGAQLRQVAILVARIAREVLGGGELQRIDEDRRGDGIRFAPRRGNEFDVPRMQCAHRRHQAKAAPSGAERGGGGAERGKIAADQHRANHCPARHCGCSEPRRRKCRPPRRYGAWPG